MLKTPIASDCSQYYLLCFFFMAMIPTVYKYMEKFVILLSIGVIVIKGKETRVVTYTCRYSSGHIPYNSVISG